MVVVNQQNILRELSQNNTPVGIPAPIGGWNSRDSLSSMEATDAVELINWFPGTGSVKSRKGYEEFSTGFPNNVETISEFNDGLTQEMIVGSGTKLFSVDEFGVKTEIGTSFTNVRFQTVNFNGRILLNNGDDTPQNYNGTTLAASVITLKDGGGSTIVGTTADDLDGINVFKSRVYMWSTTERRFFVADTVNAFQGDFIEFPLDSISQLGGSLISMGTITRDGGAGEDDLAAFIMSTGEVIIYNGDDPTDATAWSLIGRYRIPRPISVRGVVQYKGDLKVVTETDMISVLEVIGQGGLNINPSKLTGATASAFRSHGAKYGWEAILYTKGDMLIFNIPITTNSEYEQYVTNTVTGASCRFTNQNARTWGVFQGDLYFGGATQVFKADTDFDDDGNDIPLKGQTAFTTFNISNRKQFVAVRHIIESSAGLNLSLGLAIDYGVPQAAQTVSSIASGTQWDVGLWDTFQWADELSAQEIVFSLSAQGVAISTEINILLQGDAAEWHRVDYNVDLLQGF